MLIKRIFDFIFAFIGLALLLPLFVVISLLFVFLMPGGPVIFKQERVGQFGEVFWLYKFRSMGDSVGGPSVTVLGDPRITPFGRFLRKYKLDELPGLWNVLIGNMSFVGPRPDVLGYADQLQGADRRILDVRPGITGSASLKYAREEELLAQQADPIKYNDEIIYPDKVKIDLEYIENRTFWMDIKIIFTTLWARKI